MTIESEEFYNLMQAYRHTPISDPDRTVANYQAVIAFIDKHGATGLRDMFAAAALTGMVAHEGNVSAYDAYILAGAMMEARKS